MKTPALESEQEKTPQRMPCVRERIFNAANELFYRKGIRAVGIEAIVEAAGTTKMSLYRYFSSKDELVVEWLRQNDTLFWHEWTALQSLHPHDPRRQLSLLFAKAADHAADPDSRGCPLANAAVELTDPDHPAKPLIRQHKTHFHAELVKLCEAMQIRDPVALADGLFLLLEGAQMSGHSVGRNGPGAAVARLSDIMIDAALSRTDHLQPAS